MKFQQIRRNLNNFFSVMYPSKSMYSFPKHCCQQVIPIWTKPTQRLGSYTRLSSIHHRSDSLNQNIALTVLPLQDVQIADFKTTTSKNYSNCSVSMTPNHQNSKFWEQLGEKSSNFKQHKWNHSHFPGVSKWIFCFQTGK